jgi:hypothetical protein
MGLLERGTIMLNLEVETKLSKEEAERRIRSVFGKQGHGLEIAEDQPGCISFQGGGGYVTAHVEVDGNKTKINLLTQEWEFQVKEFAADLK